MLDIAFLKLSRCAEQEVLAHKMRLGVDERHRILKLVAETEGAPRLIVSAPRPQTARERLVQEPAVRQYVERLVRRLHMHSAECVLPVLPDRFERTRARRADPRKRCDQVPGIFGVLAQPRA